MLVSSRKLHKRQSTRLSRPVWL